MSSEIEQKLAAIGQMIDAVKAMTQAIDEMSRPQKIVRDERGKIVGVEKVDDAI